MRVPLYDKTKSLSQSTAAHSSMVSVGSNSTLEERGRVTERFLAAAPSTMDIQVSLEELYIGKFIEVGLLTLNTHTAHDLCAVFRQVYVF